MRQYCRSCRLLGDDVVELVEAEAIVTLCAVDDVGIVHHLCDLVVIKGFAQFPRNALESIKVDCSSSVLVPKLEHFSHTFTALCVTSL